MSDVFQRIAELFEAARTRPPAERAAFLDLACGSDVELRRRVESLLHHHEDTGGILARPLLDTHFDVTPEAAGEAPPVERIGRYRVLRTLGEGGMGTVLLAEQESPRRRVALKVIRSGVASREVLRRFEYESQVLGRLQHPGIAQIFEASTWDSGRGAQPFFVMEYVDGRSLIDYVDSEQLGERARLELQAEVCDAVHHAHQRGVIHRDLKPANILVDHRGRSKVVDFGVARAIDPDVQMTTLGTGAGQLVGTLAYMSPEQASGDPDDVDTRSDVYALGVVLYQLLSGAFPFDLEGTPIPEAARRIRDDEPRRLGAAARGVPRDLEAIVGKAIEKDRRDRYASASDLAADIRRYLADEPVSARPQTTLYQLRKLARRHKVPVASAALVVLAIVVTAVVAVVQAERVAGQRDRAQRAEEAAESRFRESWALGNKLIFDIEEEIRGLVGATTAREQIVRTALDHLEALSAHVDDDPDLLLDLAVAYSRIGQVQGGRGRGNLGDIAGARASYERSLELIESLPPDVRDTPRARYRLAGARGRLGDVHIWQNEFDSALEDYEAALALHESVPVEAPQYGPAQRGIARCISQIGAMHLSLGAYDEADRWLRDAIARTRAQWEADPDNLLLGDAMGVVMSRLAILRGRQGHIDKALEQRRAALAHYRDLVERDPNDWHFRDSVAVALIGMGAIEMGRDPGAALAHLQEAVEIREAMHRLDPENAQAATGLAVAWERLGEAHAAHARDAEAMAAHERSLELREAVCALDPTNRTAQRELGVGCEKLGAAYLDQGDVATALHHYERGLEIREALLAAHRSPQSQRDLGAMCFHLGSAHAAAAGDETRPPAERLASWRTARSMFARSLELVRDMADRGVLAPSDQGLFDVVGQQIETCDAAIGALEGE